MRLIAVTVFLFLTQVASADDVFSWTDKDGTVHYGTSDSHPNAEKVKLPKLQREDIDTRIESIKLITPKNCQQHGGVDCSRGMDNDGSVICLDGFTDALLPFRFACVEVKLESLPPAITSIENDEKLTPLREISLGADQNIQTRTIKTSVRNLSGNLAKHVQVSIFIPSFGEFVAHGPRSLEAFGLAEYSLPVREISAELRAKHLRKGAVRVKCTNCSGIINRHQ